MIIACWVYVGVPYLEELPYVFVKKCCVKLNGETGVLLGRMGRE